MIQCVANQVMSYVITDKTRDEVPDKTRDQSRDKPVLSKGFLVHQY